MTKPKLSKRGSGATSTIADGSVGVAPAPAAGSGDVPMPSQPIEMVFCFDTTGSMSSVINTVKERIIELSERLLADIPGIRIGILAHGDYGDEPHLLQQLDLTSNQEQLCSFVRDARGTSGGGDSEECYELALHEVRTSFSWRPGTRKRLVIIGDNLPHELSSARNLRKLDWKHETQALKDEQQLSIYSVQAYPCQGFSHFWKALADMTGGKHLQLDNLSSIFDFLMAICYLEHGVEFFEAYGEEVRGRDEPCAPDVTTMLRRLDEETREPASSAPDSPSSDTDINDDDDDTDTLRRPRHAPMKRKRATASAKKTASRRAAAITVSMAARKKTSNKQMRKRREQEDDLCVPDAMRLTGRWSTWQALASRRQQALGLSPTQMRRFGLGWIRSKLSVNGLRSKQRILVELGVRPDSDTDSGSPASPTVLYSRILRSSVTNVVSSLLQGNKQLKWHIHRSLLRDRRVEIRWRRVDDATDAPKASPTTDAGAVRRERRLLLKCNSYAWNSGRVVRAAGGAGYLSERCPRPRLMSRFMQSLKEMADMEVE